MTINMYTQKDLEETQKSTGSNDSPALTVQTSSKTLETATVDDQTDNHPARTAVFATNEILSLILSKDPNSANLIRVSKIWNCVVYNDIGYSIQPSNVRANYPMFVPEYAKTFSGRIHVNPMLIYHSEKNGGKWSKPRIWTMTFRVEHRFASVLRTSGDQYLTSPPITHLVLSLRTSHGCVDGLASLRVKDGIRLRDVAEVLGKLCQNLPAECRSKSDSTTGYLGYVFDAQIFCARQREFL